MRTKLAPFTVTWLPLFLVLALDASSSNAQNHVADEQQTQIPEWANNEWSWNNNTAPDRIRLMLFLRWPGADYQYAKERINSMLSAGEFRAEDIGSLLAYFRDLQVELWSELDRGRQRVACHDRASELSMVELRAVLNAYREFRESTFAKYVAIASAELASMGYVDFPEKLRKMVGNNWTLSREDYVDLESVPEERLIERRVAICKRVTSLDSATAQITPRNTQY